MNQTTFFSRREFLKTAGSATIGAAALVAGSRFVFAEGAEKKIRVGVIGCGGRGTGAAIDLAEAAGSQIEIVALADAFDARLQSCLQKLQTEFPAQCKIKPDHCFAGLDAFEKLLKAGVDMVILAAPPGFRPMHFKAAIDAGAHVFMEKPVCVDPVGYRTVVASAELATQKKLCIVAGTQRRHAANYRQTIKRIHDGAIGEIVGGQCYWVGRPVHHRGEQTTGMSDIEFQCRNWYNWTWTCGDHIVEQHVHNIDAVTWAIGALPVKACGQGGRQSRKERGNIWDHFAVEFEYPNGVRIASYCAHFEGINGRVSENVVGTKGKSNCSNDIQLYAGNGWHFEGRAPDPYVAEHAHLIAAITGKAPYINEGKQVADSTMIAVMGRMAAYTGREISWKWATEKSQLNLMPPKFEFGPFQPHPVAIPGVTQLI